MHPGTMGDSPVSHLQLSASDVREQRGPKEKLFLETLPLTCDWQDGGLANQEPAIGFSGNID